MSSVTGSPVITTDVYGNKTSTITTTVIWHKIKTATTSVTLNKDKNGNVLSSTAGYTKLSTSSPVQTISTASNGDKTITNTTTVIWELTGSSTNSAFSLTQDIASSGNISSSGQQVYYKFIAPTAGAYSFYTTGTLDTVGMLQDSLSNTLGSNDDSNGRNFLISPISLTAGQVVYLRVNAYSSSIGAYSVVAHKLQSITQTVTINQDESGIVLGDNVDTSLYHKMSTTGPTVTTSVNSTGDTVTTISTSNIWHLIVSTTKNITVNKDQNGNVLSSTTGYSQVSSSTTTTTSVASNGDKTITNTTTVIWKLNSSSGDSTATAINLPLDTATAGSISTAGQAVYYKFTATVAGDYSFYTTGNLDTQGTLTSSSNSQLDYNDDVTSGQNFNFLIKPTTLTAGQVVYLKVNAYSNNTGAYTVFAHKVATITKSVTINQDQNGNVLNSTTGYTLVSSTQSSSTDIATNGDVTVTNTTTKIWKLQSSSLSLASQLPNVATATTSPTTDATGLTQTTAFTSTVKSIVNDFINLLNETYMDDSNYSQYSQIDSSTFSSTAYKNELTTFQSKLNAGISSGNFYIASASEASTTYSTLSQWSQRYNQRLAQDINLLRSKLGLTALVKDVNPIDNAYSLTDAAYGALIKFDHYQSANGWLQPTSGNFAWAADLAGDYLYSTPEQMANANASNWLNEVNNDPTKEVVGHYLSFVGAHNMISSAVVFQPSPTMGSNWSVGASELY
ncbi:hypothetical protein [Lactococcus termiticola]|uniref:Uncharacterized protein n=1 Tax=Lactococcus termiticola TaxID=2169526 RepID=A0A2R5HIZ5_9LACT|nr:hypothetical protein [Lactococcus termiticola]GBG96418.1 hypothetical protein NtB2_00530 [Lactococcus termiticola]